MLTSDEIVAVVIRALDLPADYKLKLETQISDVPGWDSFGWVAVISALEGDSQIELIVEHIESVQTVGDFVEFVRSPANSRKAG